MKVLNTGTAFLPLSGGTLSSDLTISTLTQYRVVIVGASGILADDANLLWQDGVFYAISSTDGRPQAVYRAITSTPSSAGLYNFQRARAGTTAVLSGDNLGGFLWGGYQNGGFQSAAQIAAVVQAAPSGSVVPGYLAFYVTSLSALDTIPMLVHPAGVAIGAFTPTAALHLKAGTATAGTAPLKLTTGVNTTAVEPGAVEFDGAHFYGSVGTSRYQLEQRFVATTKWGNT